MGTITESAKAFMPNYLKSEEIFTCTRRFPSIGKNRKRGNRVSEGDGMRRSI